MESAEGLARLSHWCLNLASLWGPDAYGGFQVDKSAMVPILLNNNESQQGWQPLQEHFAEDDNEDRKGSYFCTEHFFLIRFLSFLRTLE